MSKLYNIFWFVANIKNSNLILTYFCVCFCVHYGGGHCNGDHCDGGRGHDGNGCGYDGNGRGHDGNGYGGRCDGSLVSRVYCSGFCHGWGQGCDFGH